jgi:hypothetical protein
MPPGKESCSDRLSGAGISLGWRQEASDLPKIFFIKKGVG